MSEREFLTHLTDDDKRALEQAGQQRRIPARSRVFDAGDAGYEVLILERGAVKLTRVSTEGREIVLAVREEGAILGELSAIDGGARSASASTLVETQLLAVPFATFSALLDTRASMAHALLNVLAERLRGTTDQALEFGTVDALSRVCRRLVEFADAQAGEAADGVVLAAPLTQQDIASLSGLSREAVVKALRSLRTLGWIDVRGKVITIRDLTALRERAIG